VVLQRSPSLVWMNSCGGIQPHASLFERQIPDERFPR
jgi:hypothetical protein